GSRLVESIPSVTDGLPTQFVREADLGPPELPDPTPRPATIVNLADVEPKTEDRPRIARTRRNLGRGAGSVTTGLQHVTVMPGKLSAPQHCHSAEEEILVVLEGDGVLLLGADEPPVVPGPVGVSRLLPRTLSRTKSTKGAEVSRVIAFANQKGGVAKTTTTLNLGVAFKERGFRVLVVDLDPQGNLTMSQGMNPDDIERSMFDVLVHRLPIEEIIEEREVDIAVSSIDLAGAELALSSMIGRERALEKALVSVREA